MKSLRTSGTFLLLLAGACGGGAEQPAAETGADSLPGMTTGTTGAPGPGTAGTPGTPAATEPDTLNAGVDSAGPL